MAISAGASPASDARKAEVEGFPFVVVVGDCMCVCVCVCVCEGVGVCSDADEPTDE